MTPRSRFVAIPGHEIHVMDWGPAEAPPLILSHGLARTGRDFDELAAGLAGRWRVICPDTIGRGLSSWAADAARDYAMDAYAAQALALLDALGLGRVAWLGTSMGGLIGMRIAAGAQADRLSALIVNDIGPEVPQPAIDRIVTYVGALPDFATVAEAGAWLREVYIPFGPAAEPYWQRMAETSVRRRGDGKLTLHYDPQIVDQFVLRPEDFRRWDYYERITTPFHLFRGAQSDLLTEEIAARMQGSGPRPGLTVVPGCGHAPSLVGAEAIAQVGAVLDRLSGRAG